MASARKKQDEKNLKILRELVSLPGNKHCFDCNQRGPTYVNMTIGSFVCTKCSGMLRGLMPPHRVKSISMASFTAEEVEFVRCRGNEHCRETWLALYDQQQPGIGEVKDEEQIKDFMIEKYESKQYYHDKGLSNGSLPNLSRKNAVRRRSVDKTDPPSVSSAVQRPVGSGAPSLQFKTIQNGAPSPLQPADTAFVADFGSADIFSASQFNNNVQNAKNTSTTAQPSFANFDNNIIFNSSTYPQADTNPSSYDLLVSQLSQMSPRHVTNCWNMTTSSPLSVNGATNGSGGGGGVLSSSPMGRVAAPPSEDRYAALKDLDNALKSQQQQEQHQLEWAAATPNSNGSGYASPHYGSPSTTMYGSPSQGHFATSFDLNSSSSNISNPFSGQGSRGPWAPAVNGNAHSNMNGNGHGTVIANNFPAFGSGAGGANPFRSGDAFAVNGVSKYNNPVNGFNGNHFQQNLFNTSSHQNVHLATSKPWISPNPFAQLGTSTGGNSNNPFL